MQSQPHSVPIFQSLSSVPTLRCVQPPNQGLRNLPSVGCSRSPPPTLRYLQTHPQHLPRLYLTPSPPLHTFFPFPVPVTTTSPKAAAPPASKRAKTSRPFQLPGQETHCIFTEARWLLLTFTLKPVGRPICAPNQRSSVRRNSQGIRSPTHRNTAPHSPCGVHQPMGRRAVGMYSEAYTCLAG